MLCVRCPVSCSSRCQETQGGGGVSRHPLPVRGACANLGRLHHARVLGHPVSLEPRVLRLYDTISWPAKAPEVLAGVIAMLMSEDGVHITGEDIRVDGGTLS